MSLDEWRQALGSGRTDDELRSKLQDCMLLHARDLLRAGVSVVLEFGCFTRAERDGIRKLAAEEGATVELHFMDAPGTELVERVRTSAGADAEALASDLLSRDAAGFERPTDDEAGTFDRYVGPDEPWQSGDGVAARAALASAARVIRQGDVFWVPAESLSPSLPGAPHPQVVIQSDLLNQSRIPTTVVCAITSNLKRVEEPGSVLLEAGEAGLPRRSVVVVSRVCTVNKAALVTQLGALSPARVQQILDGMELLQRSFFNAH